MQITIDLGDRSYPVFIGSRLLENALALLSPYISGKQICIVSNEIVAPLYLSALENQLKNHFEICSVILPDGEANKNLETLSLIYETLLKNACNRDVTLIALGGGIVGDITGFAAASFMRGVNFIQIPTTLLAQVDSSVGGKTGVNHPLGKNMIGAFYQPRCVLADVDVLKTLPSRELSAGLSEVIKYGFIADKVFLNWLEINMPRLLKSEQEALIYAVQKSCECKANVVGQDEKETGLRAILNLGHTFGHAIEAYYHYQGILHGEAVAIGMHMAIKLSELMSLITKEDLEFSKRIMLSANLPVQTNENIDCEVLFDFMKVDKKAHSGKIRLVLLKCLGEALITDNFSKDDLFQAMRFCMPN